MAELIKAWEETFSGTATSVKSIFGGNPTAPHDNQFYTETPLIQVDYNGDKFGRYSSDLSHVPFYDFNHPELVFITAVWYNHQTINRSDIDLRGGKLKTRVRAQALSLPKRARICFWIQAIDPLAGHGEGQYVNYAQINNQLSDALGVQRPLYRASTPSPVWTQWQVIEIPFSSDESHWLAMGTRSKWQYGKSISAEQALSLNFVDMGFLTLLGEVDTSPTQVGHIDFDYIELWLDSERNPWLIV